VLAVGYGLVMVRTFDAPAARTQDVILVQGNASLAEKRDIDSARRNVALLYDMSRRAVRPGSLIVWPEGAIPAFVPTNIGTARRDGDLPWLGDGSALLVGTYSYDGESRRYNSAFAVLPDGNVPAPYAKQALIPFGEYMPLANVLPWFQSLNAQASVFTAGTGPRVFHYPMAPADRPAYELRISPLICYEDTLPDLAREATRAGAELLVNITSDSWFGRSVAPHQHHLIASFRAIENRRYLVRATNTGLSAVVDPLGRTIAQIPVFTQGTATARVALLDYCSPYTALVGDTPWWALMALGLLSVAGKRLGRP
jgi:apolipoprotein N-acyltransferase